MVPSGPQVTAIRVSPGFRLRPSLSVGGHRLRAAARLVSPGFRLRPSLSVSRHTYTPWSANRVSPGFRLRPSLSELPRESLRRRRRGVAGVQTPAFVERRTSSPPSLRRWSVSPGFRLRPSLSAERLLERHEEGACVAGVQTPAFVERISRPPTFDDSTRRVAGVQTPAFVERRCTRRAPCASAPCRRGSDSGLR